MILDYFLCFYTCLCTYTGRLDIYFICLLAMFLLLVLLLGIFKNCFLDIPCILSVVSFTCYVSMEDVFLLIVHLIWVNICLPGYNEHWQGEGCQCDRLFRTPWAPEQQPLAQPKTKAKTQTHCVHFHMHAGEEQLQRKTTSVLVSFPFKAVLVVSHSWYYFGTFFCSSRSDFPRSVTITGLSKQLSLQSIEQGCKHCCFHFINPGFFLLFSSFILFWLLEGSA